MESQLRVGQGHIDKARLQAALTSRIVIEQAKGILAERTGTGVDEAFHAMRASARPRQVLLADLVRHIINNTVNTKLLTP